MDRGPPSSPVAVHRRRRVWIVMCQQDMPDRAHGGDGDRESSTPAANRLDPP